MAIRVAGTACVDDARALAVSGMTLDIARMIGASVLGPTTGYSPGTTTTFLDLTGKTYSVLNSDPPGIEFQITVFGNGGFTMRWNEWLSAGSGRARIYRRRPATDFQVATTIHDEPISGSLSSKTSRQVIVSNNQSGDIYNFIINVPSGSFSLSNVSDFRMSCGTAAVPLHFFNRE